MRRILSDFMDPRPLALARMLVGVAAAGFSFEWISVLARAASGKYLALPVFAGWPAPSPVLVLVLFALSLLASAAMVLGLAGRLPALLTSGTTAAVLLADQQTYSNHLVLLMMLAGYLGMSGAAEAWTVSRAEHPAKVAYWPAFLIKAQITTVYAWTAVAKINPQYLSGEVLGTYLQPWAPIPDEILPIVAVSSILAEVFLAVGLWIARTRRAAFVAGAALHIGIVVLLQNPAPLIGFAVLMAAGYVLFAAGRESWPIFRGSRPSVPWP
ncbi:hypothetical protein D7Z96_07215 [Pseudarthrobacter phenanthrenivorans]|uniref:HTTM-like domain-containing protein n=1 Tax=Pseudarthrobacter phenanthrenivorans TaxID=361575 RepID=A0A3B0G069_PSEPS|nr:HTTM domain-containing protein [Pseudarthrobacter phenanthrenivorans]RKO25580.1 hypothetical protein D7Z96_07215 [Pseudarthrobacter phenanthrenivorans]